MSIFYNTLFILLFAHYLILFKAIVVSQVNLIVVDNLRSVVIKPVALFLYPIYFHLLPTDLTDVLLISFKWVKLLEKYRTTIPKIFLWYMFYTLLIINPLHLRKKSRWLILFLRHFFMFFMIMLIKMLVKLLFGILHHTAVQAVVFTWVVNYFVIFINIIGSF